jgi:hypothetical protein
VWTWFELLEGHMYSDNVYFLVCIYVAIALKGITNCEKSLSIFGYAQPSPI